MPSQWTIDLVGIKPHQVRNSGIHRFLSAWFAETGTDHRDLKAYSLRERLDHRDGVRLTLGVIADRLAPLISAIPVGQPIQFGDNPGRVATVGVAPSCQSEISWADLAKPHQSNQWRIWLQSPMTFRRKGLDQPWPAPYQVLDSLRSRWLLGSGQQLIENTAVDQLARSIAVTGADVSTEERQWGPREAGRVFGAVGVVEWTWTGESQRGAGTVAQLLRLAEFSGVGGYPQHGFGSVSLEARRIDPRRPRG